MGHKDRISIFKITNEGVFNSENMASNLEGSIHRESDLLFDFYCLICQENDGNTEAEFYCGECSRFYCSKCVEHHNFLFKKHVILGKKNISQWPEINESELEQCQQHKKEKLTGFCEDHNQLICHACHINIHQKCSYVVLVADKVKDLHQKGDFKQLSTNLDTQHQQLIQKKDDFEKKMKSLEKSYQNILKQINALRKKINDSLDQMEKNTKKDLDIFLANIKTSIQTDIENCNKSIKNITSLKEDWLRRKDKTEALSLMTYRKCLDQSLKEEAVLQELTTKNERTLTFNPVSTIQYTLSTLSGLGQILSEVKIPQASKGTTRNTLTTQNNHKASCQSDQVSDPVLSSSHQLMQRYQPDAVSMPDAIIKVKNSKTYSVKIERDSSECSIAGICETASGELLIIDKKNHRVKLLDQNYRVVAFCNLHGNLRSMCSIDSSQVAVAVENKQVHFIRLANGQLIKDRTLPFKHDCLGIACHQGNLYITDHEALYHYTLDGGLVCKMYTDTSDETKACAVSPDGDRIYIACNTPRRDGTHFVKLVTLSRDGTVISIYRDCIVIPISPSWFFPLDLSLREYISNSLGLHVTDSGQVLVCGDFSQEIIQVDRDGRKRLAVVVTDWDGVTNPRSVYYSKNTGSLIVGMMKNNIIVFKAK